MVDILCPLFPLFSCPSCSQKYLLAMCEVCETTAIDGLTTSGFDQAIKLNEEGAKSRVLCGAESFTQKVLCTDLMISMLLTVIAVMVSSLDLSRPRISVKPLFPTVSCAT